VDTLVSIVLVVQGEGRQNPQLDSRSIAVLLHGANNLNSTF
jgi:hypothetical protein